MKVHGTVKDILSREALGMYTVRAYDVDDTAHVVNGQIPINGEYELWLFERRSYMVVFSAPGYVEKRALFQLNTLTGKQWAGGYGVPLSILLFREVPGLDLTFNGEAFGINRYDALKKKFAWDMDHLARMNRSQAALMEDYEEKLRQIGVPPPSITPVPMD